MPLPPILHRARSLVAPSRSDDVATELIPVVDRAFAMRVLALAMRVADLKLSVGASANDVTLAITRIADAYGVRPVHVDVTYTSIAVSYQRSTEHDPLTLLRVARPAAPDHTRLQRLQALMVDIEAGLSFEDARDRFRAIRTAPFPYRPAIVILSQGLLAVGFCILMGGSPLIAAIAAFASMAAAMAQRGMARLHLPFFFSQVAGAVVVTAAAVGTSVAAGLGVEALQGVRPSLIVAAGIVLMLSGVSAVATAQDAIDGFAVTAMGRALEVTVLTVGIVAGILGGLQVAAALGFGVTVSSAAAPVGTPAEQAIGSVLIAASVAIINGATAATIGLSGALGLVAWAVWFGGTTLEVGAGVASAAGACVASFVGIVVAHRLHVPSIAVTTAAIIPLVPGYTLFRGLLEVVESGGGTDGLVAGTAMLAGAATVGLALAAGATLGLVIGAPVRDTVNHVVRRRRRAY